jgi:dimethylaniline monooxygenase (N-oxide forming)
LVIKLIKLVGTGNSGCDIATEISKVAKMTYIITKKGALIIPKFIFGYPTDHIFLNRFFQTILPSFITDLIILIFIYIFQGKMSYYGFTPSEELRSHPTGILY